MSTSNKIRFACILVLWLLLCYLLISGRGINAMTVITIIISGGVVFIPLYKKYIKNNKD